MTDRTPPMKAQSRYRWPWFLAVAAALAVGLAIFAVTKEANRVHQQQQYRIPAVEK